MALQHSYELQADAASVRNNMEVYASDGGRLGMVTEVWAYIPSYGYVARSSFAVADYGPIRGTHRLLNGADGYVRVRPSRGIRAEDTNDLFVPFGAIQDIVSGEALILGDCAETCQASFAARPRHLAASR